MKSQLIKDIKLEKDGKTVILGGWVDSIRDIGKIKFYLLKTIFSHKKSSLGFLAFNLWWSKFTLR